MLLGIWCMCWKVHTVKWMNHLTCGRGGERKRGISKALLYNFKISNQMTPVKLSPIYFYISKLVASNGHFLWPLFCCWFNISHPLNSYANTTTFSTNQGLPPITFFWKCPSSPLWGLVAIFLKLYNFTIFWSGKLVTSLLEIKGMWCVCVCMHAFNSHCSTS